MLKYIASIVVMSEITGKYEAMKFSVAAESFADAVITIIGDDFIEEYGPNFEIVAMSRQPAEQQGRRLLSVVH
ncbi:MAG: hypothetical protein KBT88_03550 [Gammaproteobacteria bacterium]|nr:hypothetical protein [Gammaproteobacteria bacterium]MBQ0838836.1 hypothetical protein [Gammaproteobacteria bacterium]